MGRPANVIPSVLLKAWIPTDLRAKLDLQLYSEVEGCVPRGKYSEFVADRLREFFGWRRLDLGQLIGAPAGLHIIAGTPDTIAIIESVFKAAPKQESTHD